MNQSRGECGQDKQGKAVPKPLLKWDFMGCGEHILVSKRAWMVERLTAVGCCGL